MIAKFFKGFVYAFRGLFVAVRNERNLKFHIFAAVCVVIAGILLQISVYEWIACALCIGLVIAAEMINTAVETLCDVVEPSKNDKIGMIKDVSAGAVLVCAIAAAAVGLIIFIPKIIALF